MEGEFLRFSFVDKHLAMLLSKIKYSQFEDENRKWNLNEVGFGKINLLVGKNSSGKSKTLAIINSLSALLSENVKLLFVDGYYLATFQQNNSTYQYELRYRESNVILENLFLNGGSLIARDADGGGDILTFSGNRISGYAGGELKEFKIPPDELKANRRDEIQYPYLEDLNFWARHVRKFEFSSLLGKNAVAILDKTQKNEFDFKLKETEKVISIFNQGKTKYGKKFIDNIVKDFNSIGFDITDVGVGPLVSIYYKTENPGFEVVGLRVQERNLACATDQNDMSNGMYRALSIIIHFNYYELEEIPGTVLIDDVGEGLDYERSTELIKLLISKIESTHINIQLIMATNDRFVMNVVDLKYWQIIDRVGSEVSYYNIKNSQKAFEDFKFTGLANFDFFSTGFFKTGYESEQ